MMNPVADLLVDGHNAQSNSGNDKMLEVTDLENNSPNPSELLTYLSTLCIALRSCLVEFCIC